MEVFNCLLVFGFLSFFVFFGVQYIISQRKRNKLMKWDKSPKDKVILHGMYGGKVFLPSASPFVLKLETYLRMCEIPYEIDKNDIWGPKGKTPWISLNGKHIGDSQFIIEFLGKKYEKDFTSLYTEEQKAIGTAVRIMLEEYVYWCEIQWRFAFGGRDTWDKVRKGEITLKEWIIFKMIAPSLKSMAWSQGIGRHTEEEVLQQMRKCIFTFSKILGNKKFLLGDEACEDDCAAFGILAAPVFSKDTPFRNELYGELKNVNDYCDRMKNKYWADWDKYLSST